MAYVLFYEYSRLVHTKLNNVCGITITILWKYFYSLFDYLSVILFRLFWSSFGNYRKFSMHNVSFFRLGVKYVFSYSKIVGSLHDVSFTNQKRDRITRTIMIVALCFILSWLPNHIFSFVLNFFKKKIFDLIKQS